MATATAKWQMRAAASLAALATGLFSYFVIVLLLLHILRPDYGISDHMISDYAVGKFGWSMSIAFLAAAFGCLALGIGVWWVGPSSLLGRISAVLLFLTFVRLIVTAIFPTDLETAPTTTHGTIHALSFLANVVGALLSAVCFGLSCRSSPNWQAQSALALLFAGLLGAAFIAQFITLHRGAPFGITNRLFVAVLMTWFVAMSIWLRQAAIREVRGKQG